MPRLAPHIPLSLAEVEAWPGLGCRGLAGPRVRARLGDILARIDDEHLLQPVGSYEIWPVAQQRPGRLMLENGMVLAAPLLGHHFRRARALAAVTASIGARLGEQVSAWFAAGKYLRAVLLDEIGNFALGRLTAQLYEAVEADGRRRGLSVSSPLHPGNDDGFGLDAQPDVLALSGGEALGISLSRTGMMLPEKSRSAVLGLGRDMPRWSRAQGCARCKSRARCAHRLTGAAVAEEVS
jgi:hypothetical protein